MALRPNVAKLRDLLLKAKLVDEFQMRAAMGRLEQWGGRLSGIVVEMGFVDDDTMVETLSQALKLPVMHLGMVPRDNALLAKLDAGFCDEHGIFPVSLVNRVATIAMSDPTELDTVDVIASKLNARVQVVVAPESEIKAALNKHYRGVAGPATRKQDHRARDAHIEATKGQVFELDTSAPPKPGARSGDGSYGITAPNDISAFMKRPPSANTMLDEFLDGEDGKVDGFTPEEVKRIESAVANQRKTTAILQALESLLRDKGYVS